VRGVSLDVAVIGGGITGCALAAFAAEAGASVQVFERERIAAGASGRNSGAVQHPMDPLLAPLFEETVEHYRTLGHGFALPAEPAGVLVLGVEQFETGFPELEAQRLEGAELTALEPALADDLVAVRLATGYPVPPAAATNAFSARARAAGAQIHEGTAARLWREGGRIAGVQTPDGRTPAGAVVIAAGPWSPAVADPSGRWRPIAPVWGVNVELRLPAPPRHTLEEAGVETVMSGGPPSIFALVTADGVSALGSTFLRDEPDPAAFVPVLLERGARYVPALADARPTSVRACARPQCFDGRPLLGALEENLYAVTGHGPWGISLGPASARLVADVVLGRGASIAPELRAERA
jgi:glycine/D-amino acid oxidase-like deaminating enzyme